MVTAFAAPQSTTNRLFYEWWMLCLAESELATPGISQELQNVWIESGAIHARNLAAFFFERRLVNSKPDDVFAEDLISDELWGSVRPERPKALARHEFSDPINKQIAHLTRCAEPKREWDFSAVANALQPAVERFLEVVPLELLGDRWQEKLRTRSGSRWDAAKHILGGRRNG